MADTPNLASAEQPESPTGSPVLRVLLADALRYWEPRRLAYNAVLAAVVLAVYYFYWPHSKTILTFDLLATLFILAVLANVCYCAAYVVDVFVQLSGMRSAWKVGRPLLLILGIVFAAVITRFFAMGIFAP